MIKFSYDNESEIPPALRANYTQDASGKWILQVEGAVAKSVVDQFRENNIAVTRERDQLKATFEGVDAAEYKKLKNNKALLDENKLITTEGMEAAVEKRVVAMRTELEGKVTDLTGRLEKTTSEIGRLKIDGAVIQLGVKHGLRPEAQDDYVARAQRTFKLDPNTGNPIAYEPDGVTIRYGMDSKPLTPEEWVKTTAADKAYSHLFQPSTGGGATGGARPGFGPNPFKAGNLTEQANLMRSNPAEYNRLKAEHEAPAATV